MNDVMSNGPLKRLVGFFNNKVIYPIMDTLDAVVLNQRNQEIMREKGWDESDLELVHGVLGQAIKDTIAEGAKIPEDLDAHFRDTVTEIIENDPELKENLDKADITLEDLVYVRDKQVRSAKNMDELIPHLF